jgi:hypothetical protein
MKRSLILICVLIGCTAETHDAQTAEQAVRNPGDPPLLPQLEPLRAALGPWECSSTYFDLALGPQPLVVAHTALATFDIRVGVGGQWLVGVYDEFATSLPAHPLGAKISVFDSFTINPFGVGVRSFVDSHTGTLDSTFTFDDAGNDWTGTYRVRVPGATIELPFTESLRWGPHRLSFTTDSRLDVGAGPQVFNRQVCHHADESRDVAAALAHAAIDAGFDLKLRYDNELCGISCVSDYDCKDPAGPRLDEDGAIVIRSCTRCDGSRCAGLQP